MYLLSPQGQLVSLQLLLCLYRNMRCSRQVFLSTHPFSQIEITCKNTKGATNKNINTRIYGSYLLPATYMLFSWLRVAFLNTITLPRDKILPSTPQYCKLNYSHISRWQMLKTITQQVGTRGKVCDLHWEGAWFKFQTGYWPPYLGFSVVFLSPAMQMLE